MHLNFISRGIKQNRDLFVKFLETRMFTWKTKDLKGNEVLQSVQGALRPVELWEYIFPEECLPEVLGMLGIDPSKTEDYGSLSQKMQLGVLRKMLDCKEIPKNTPVVGNSQFVFHDGMAFHVLGIKEDVRQKVEKWDREQEML